MNWGVPWYIDFADWSIISPCTKAIQTCVNFLVGTCSFTLYVLVQFYGKSKFCENGGFSLSRSHILSAYNFFLDTFYTLWDWLCYECVTTCMHAGKSQLWLGMKSIVATFGIWLWMQRIQLTRISWEMFIC